MPDKIKILNKHLKDVVEKFNALKKCGMDEEILIIYLRDKTKLSKKDIMQLLIHTEDLFDKLNNEDIVESI